MHALAFIAGLVALISLAFGKDVAAKFAMVIVAVLGCLTVLAGTFFGYVLYRVVMGTI